MRQPRLNAAARLPLACGVNPLSERRLPVGPSRSTPNHMHMTAAATILKQRRKLT
jgi:hypothetical protein